jgi:alpha-mannosidase
MAFGWERWLPYDAMLDGCVSTWGSTIFQSLFHKRGGTDMTALDRRKFMQVSAASLFMEGLLAEASPLAGAAQFFRRRQQISPDNPYRSTLERLDAMVQMPLPDWRAHADTLPHPEDPTLDDSSWQQIKIRERWTEGPVWFRRWVEIPKSMGGYNIEGLPVKLDVRVGFRGHGRIRVFSNGSIVEMGPENTQQPILVAEKAQPGQKYLIAAYAPANNGNAAIYYARLEVDYPPDKPNPATMRDEILAVQALGLSKNFPDALKQRDAQLKAAVNQINFTPLESGDQQGFENSLASAEQKMQPLAEWMKTFTIRAVGNAHIDLAWLWPWPETVEVVRDTFGTALELMDEYPQFTYAQSTAQDFVWLENYYPDLFKEIQQRVKDGRWEMVGGMWDEPDLNMPCGESLVRQLLTGMRYFKQKFGVEVKIGWNPDSFGYSWQLAQIYKRSGIDYFVTQKMSWNDTTQFPYKLFWWESPDGSRVLSYFPHGYGNGINPVQCSGFLAGDVPLCSGYRENMLLYGVGDHGGGPTRQMLDAAVRWQKSTNAAFPNFKWSTAQEFFNDVDSNLPKLNLPVWKSELYLQFHRGTYTTQAESKKRMRYSERLILNTEKFASLAMLHGREYPQPQFEDCWHRILFDQFHDMMAGSGIHINYVDEAESLDFVKLTCRRVLDGAMRLLGSRINTQGPGLPVAVFNSLSWERTDVSEAEVQFSGPIKEIEVRDSEGHAVPSAVISRDDSTHIVKVRFLARSLPPIGYKIFHVVSVEHPSEVSSTLKVNGTTLENEFLRVEIDPKTGCVTSLVNKKDGKNILRAGANGNVLETFVDKPKQYDAWNIGWPYDQSKTELLEAQEVKLVENTPIRAVVRVKKNFQNSSFIQDICMYPEVARADVHMHADWHETHIMLKVAFPLDIAPEWATYEIPYGTIERPAIPHTKAQAAEHEVCAQQWGDLSEGGRGFSLLNRCKFGYDTVEKGVIRLTLLRSPIEPDPIADRGEHDFTYSMYPHAGDWRQAGTELRGYELNYRPLPMPVEAHDGSLPASHSLVTIEPANVILTAIKKAEDDNSLIFRFYEFEGKPAQVRLTLPESATSAVETNLMEKEEQPISLGQGGTELTTSLGAYVIKSVKVTFPNSAGSVPPRRV